MHRRTFLAAAGTAVLAPALPLSASCGSSSAPVLLTGNGEWTYAVVPGWGALPAGTNFGGTHGAIAQDKAGNVYVSTQSNTGVLVYGSDGRLLRKIATAYPEIHSIVFATDGGEEYLYITVQKGNPRENWLFLKMKTDGSVVLKITAPAEAGFRAPNEWRLTAAVPAPDGSTFIANGYGDSRIFRFDKNGNYKASYSENGSAEGQLNCSHGLSLDTRYDQPLLLICDRENRRLCHFDLDGRYVRTVTQHLRRPCQVSFHGDYAVVSELEGRLTILDRDNVPVAFVGDNPQKAQWAKYDLDPRTVNAAVFSAAHGCLIDADANIFVSDWNQTGRLTKLSRLTWS
jgi:hypothetical protein